jgi:dephospho-CoA kinase
MGAVRQRPIVLGITGGVATGKSTVLGMFAKRGAFAISADEIARSLLAPGASTTMRVLAHFGPSFALKGTSDTVDRSALGRLVFADEQARRELGKLMHPAIHEELQREIDKACRDPECLLAAAEIPLLYENRLERMVDRVVVATCSAPEQLRRLMARVHGLSESEALAQIHAQIPTQSKAEMSDFVIDTGASLNDVDDEVGRLFTLLAARRVEEPG